MTKMAYQTNLELKENENMIWTCRLSLQAERTNPFWRSHWITERPLVWLNHMIILWYARKLAMHLLWRLLSLKIRTCTVPSPRSYYFEFLKALSVSQTPNSKVNKHICSKSAAVVVDLVVPPLIITIVTFFRHIVCKCLLCLSNDWYQQNSVCAIPVLQ